MPTVLCMARCVQISDYFSVEPQAGFLNFTIYFTFWKSSDLKIWRLYKYALTLIKRLISNELYAMLCLVIYWKIPTVIPEIITPKRKTIWKTNSIFLLLFSLQCFTITLNVLKPKSRTINNANRYKYFTIP